MLIELSNQILGKVGHFFKRLDTFTVEPFPRFDLLGISFLLVLKPILAWFDVLNYK